ncbi:hypothetical protein MCOR27_010435 [Pyricularia oryzae]|uniref:Nitrate reductase n=2 Tax=Pyricularia TaxID=48558 RepID=A0ABQ8N7T8_PYRGI|nr:hypothetical protein MCOR01_000793 [Pyricularia oryzae]KAI6291908.1 hypothetical protein MCOR33_010244 [Pyricularia grisea]KAH9428445.1 hypothetical protein MCOR02_010996 [Pyricularia oryzae]KAI6253337.1 hypothetical protein MCOR19_010092 [Pyricularia oryzae]KAI6267816.1 hypothetical protein MCOR27_010435 [Pyricularia oryzae]
MGTIVGLPPIPTEAPPSYTTVKKLDIFPPSPPDTAKESRQHSRRSSISVGTGLVEDVDCAVVNDEASRPYPLPPPTRQNNVLPQDLKTPDSHVERDPRLIRLTGIHPFNTEAPLSDLFDEGFINSKDLHYVRNHGAVPRVEDADMMDWEFTVEGMVESPMKLTLRTLMKDFAQATYPVTLVCAGNRRKEQNVVRKTKGFSWGAAGLSTALWTGVPLGDLLARAMPKRGARYVYFEGADKLPNGYYGTSIKLNWAVDPNRGIMVAHRMNGEALHPDHGKPLRIVIPGQIGGRSVKWLKRIVVTSEPSDNWYHIYDNRVLPTMVTPEASADLPDTWKDERYAIYDLNTNSATCYPAHDEKVPITAGAGVYKFRGYAYAGGGKRVTRMEVTLDKGKSWRLAKMIYPEDDYRLASVDDTLYGGKVDLSWREASFCWCFWELDIPTTDLVAADDVMIRAMDDSMMVQPRDMYWSVLGMMNNPWYRVMIHKEGHDLRFEHPTQPALIPGGWMERVKKAGGDLSNGFWGERVAGDEEESAAVAEEPANEICMTNPSVNKTITLDELKAHDSESQPWFVVDGQVYDGIKFLEGHPGGAASIIGAAGQDCSEEFLTIHSENAKAMMPEYHIGSLDEKSRSLLAEPESTQPESTEPRPVFLQSRTWSKALLQEKISVSGDSKIFSFKLDHAEQAIGLPVGQHLMMRLRDPATREAIIRAYTPLSDCVVEKGLLRVLVKIYYKSAGMEGGKMTQALDHLPVGHWVDFKGPVGRFEYLGKGKCRVSGKERSVRRFIMICGGSGVTPIFQVFRAVMQDKEDQTRCLVLDGNRTEEDILCKDELDKLAVGNEDRCRLVYSLSKPSESWTGAKGRMDRALFEKELGVSGSNSQDMVLICGPESMEKSVKQILTQELGWKDDDLLFF